MLKKVTLVAAALAVSAAFLGASSASAAFLYTTTAKKTLVPVGTTFTAAEPFWNGKELPTPEQEAWRQLKELEGTEVNSCLNASISFKVTQNSGGTFKAVPTGATFPTCVLSQKWGNNAEAPGQELSVTGSSTANGAETAWLGTKFNFAWGILPLGEGFFGKFTGATGSPPSKGVFVQQPTAAKAPISINAVKAPIKGLETLSAKLIFTGAAAAWSFG